MLCNGFLEFEPKKHKRPLSTSGLNVFSTSFKQFGILPGFYQSSQCYFYKLLTLLIKWWRRRELKGRFPAENPINRGFEKVLIEF